MCLNFMEGMVKDENSFARVLRHAAIGRMKKSCVPPYETLAAQMGKGIECCLAADAMEEDKLPQGIA